MTRKQCQFILNWGPFPPLSYATAEHCLYIFLFLGSEGGAWHSAPLRTLVLENILNSSVVSLAVLTGKFVHMRQSVSTEIRTGDGSQQKISDTLACLVEICFDLAHYPLCVDFLSAEMFVQATRLWRIFFPFSDAEVKEKQHYRMCYALLNTGESERRLGRTQTLGNTNFHDGNKWKSDYERLSKICVSDNFVTM